MKTFKDLLREDDEKDQTKVTITKDIVTTTDPETGEATTDVELAGSQIQTSEKHGPLDMLRTEAEIRRFFRSKPKPLIVKGDLIFPALDDDKMLDPKKFVVYDEDGNFNTNNIFSITEDDISPKEYTDGGKISDEEDEDEEDGKKRIKMIQISGTLNLSNVVDTTNRESVETELKKYVDYDSLRIDLPKKGISNLIKPEKEKKEEPQKVNTIEK